MNPSLRSLLPATLLVLAAGLLACEDRSADDILTSGQKLYSQNDEELVIRHFFRDRRGGFFVDVGAARPTEASTTYYLEKHLGWSGIGIDALPEYAPQWKEHRPRSRFFSYLVGDHSGTIESFYRTGGAPDLSSIQKERVFAGKKLGSTEIHVPTITLNDLLDREGVERIDFLSMDIEESEPAALAGFDIERFRPELVCIEATPSIRPRILEYFGKHGYERIDAYLAHDTVNWYFTPKG